MFSTYMLYSFSTQVNNVCVPLYLQDVDLLPETDKNIFYCDTQARHLSPAIDEQRYHPLFYNQFGGAVALNKDNYIKMNGFPNRYAGWGSEDDDVCARTIGAGELNDLA